MGHERAWGGGERQQAPARRRTRITRPRKQHHTQRRRIPEAAEQTTDGEAQDHMRMQCRDAVVQLDSVALAAAPTAPFSRHA